MAEQVIPSVVEPVNVPEAALLENEPQPEPVPATSAPDERWGLRPCAPTESETSSSESDVDSKERDAAHALAACSQDPAERKRAKRARRHERHLRRKEKRAAAKEQAKAAAAERAKAAAAEQAKAAAAEQAKAAAAEQAKKKEKEKEEQEKEKEEEEETEKEQEEKKQKKGKAKKVVPPRKGYALEPDTLAPPAKSWDVPPVSAGKRRRVPATKIEPAGTQPKKQALTKSERQALQAESEKNVHIDSLGNIWGRGAKVWVSWPHLPKRQLRVCLSMLLVGRRWVGYFADRNYETESVSSRWDRPLLAIWLTKSVEAAFAGSDPDLATRFDALVLAAQSALDLEHPPYSENVRISSGHDRVSLQFSPVAGPSALFAPQAPQTR